MAVSSYLKHLFLITSASNCDPGNVAFSVTTGYLGHAMYCSVQGTQTR
jgi:hypothetical protein